MDLAAGLDGLLQVAQDGFVLRFPVEAGLFEDSGGDPAAQEGPRLHPSTGTQRCHVLEVAQLLRGAI